MINSFFKKITPKTQKLKIAAGIIFFNDCFSLKRCLNSIDNGVDIIFAIDGKFSNFPSDSNLSTDGSRELIKSYSQSVLVDFPGNEVEKRSKYLELCAKHHIDVLLIIDSDEFVLEDANWELFRNSLNRIVFDRDGCKHNVCSINLQTVGKAEEFMAYPRIWYKPNEMEYYGNRHYFYRNKVPNKTNVPHMGDHTNNIVQGIKLGHDHNLRSRDHMDNRFIYQSWLQNFEKSLPTP